MKWFTACKSLREVKSRYRKLAIKHHPDKNPGIGDSAMKEINREYHEIQKYGLGGQPPAKPQPQPGQVVVVYWDWGVNPSSTGVRYTVRYTSGSSNW